MRWPVVAILLFAAPGAAQTPSAVQSQINAVPWTNGLQRVTGSEVQLILTGITSLFTSWAAPMASPVFTGSVTVPYTGYLYGNGAGQITASLTIPSTAITGGLPPSGTAGGDLSGTFPNPSVAKVAGVTINGVPASGNLVGTTDVQTLTNKTLTNPAIGTIANTGTLTLPTSTDTLVGRATTDTLTNKSIAATQLTGAVPAANMPALTGDVTSAAGTVATTVGKVSGVTINSVPASGNLVGTTDTQTLTNKTLTAPVIASISNTGTVTLPTATDTLVGRATTDTLTNKSIVATQLTGTVAAAQMPALTGDCTTSSGAVATTCTKINNILPGQPYFRAAMKSAGQSSPTTVTTTVLFDTDVLDSGSYYATGTGKFTPLIAGTYFVHSCLTVTAGWTLGNANISAIIVKNAAVLANSATSAATGTDVYNICMDALTAMNGSTDFLIVQTNLTGTSPVVTGNASSPSYITAYRIGP